VTRTRTSSHFDQLVAISRDLSAEVDRLSFGLPVTHVYNPLGYARGLHEQYLRRFAAPGKAALFLGMNPGPWGMAQTGVPFGEVAAVRDWMGIDGEVEPFEGEHPKRPIEGLACTRSEVSGRRLWGWAAERFETPEAFFSRFFIINYCPLIFLEESGRNRTPDRLPIAERRPLEEACDRALAATIELLEPEWVIGVGGFAEKRAQRILADHPLEGAIRVGRILHPSPASPAANRGWQEQAEAQLRELGVGL